MLGTIVSILFGVLVGYFFYVLQRSRSRLNYQTSNLQIIGNISLKLPSEFEVTVAGVRIESLQKSQIVIWNGGTNTINGTDIVVEDYLKIVFGSSTKIFSVNVTALSRTVNKFTAEKDSLVNNEVILKFDFLDPKDGVIVEILHTNSNAEPKIMGTVKGLKNGIKYKGQINYLNRNKKKRWLRILQFWGFPLIAALILGSALYALIVVFREIFIGESNLLNYVTMVLGCFIPFIFMFNNLFLFKRKFPRNIKDIDK